MHVNYKDIRDRIAAEPLWFDEQTVPRYCEFSPEVIANQYATEAALVLIACQGCNVRMKRAYVFKGLSEAIQSRELPTDDPPNIECCAAGSVMTAVEIRVLEYWRRSLDSAWLRDANLEIEVLPLHLQDDSRYDDGRDPDVFFEEPE